jgi:hypothetical protein
MQLPIQIPSIVTLIHMTVRTSIMKCSFVYLIPHLDLNLYIVPNQFICKAITEKEHTAACSVENADYKLILRYFGKNHESCIISVQIQYMTFLLRNVTHFHYKT